MSILMFRRSSTRSASGSKKWRRTLADPRSDPRSLARFRAAVELARSLPFPVNLWQVQNLFYESFGRAPGNRAWAQNNRPRTGCDWARDLAQLGETLLFTPEALNLMSHSTSAQQPMRAIP